MNARRFIRSIRVEASLAGVAYAGLLVVANPSTTAARLDLPAFPWANRLFNIAIVVAMTALGCLAISLWGRLLATGHRRRVQGECRACTGTVMAEFALVLPIVLLIMSTIIQMALIANASLVVRYAAFAAARSAIVSFESEMPGFHPLTSAQFPPWPEWVDKERPQRAAHLVLASISPRTGGSETSAVSMERLLQTQQGVWQNGGYAERFRYAQEATEVYTLYDDFGLAGGWYESFPPLIPKLEHLVAPYPYSTGNREIYNPFLVPTDLQLLPTSIRIPRVPGLPNLFPDKIDLPPRLVDPVNKLPNQLLGFMRSGQSAGVDLFANSFLNIDPMSPKEVRIRVTYKFLLTLPSLFHLIPVTDSAPVVQAPSTVSAPIVGGRAFEIEHTVWLQSTGGRKGNLLSWVPIHKKIRKGPLQLNSPFWFELGDDKWWKKFW